MLSERSITRHTPIEHLLLEPAVTELERELQRRLREGDDQIDADAPLLNALNDVGVTAENADELADLVSEAKEIDAKDLREGAAFLKVISNRGFGPGEADDLDLILTMLHDECIVTGHDLFEHFAKHAELRSIVRDLVDDPSANDFERARELVEND